MLDVDVGQKWEGYGLTTANILYRMPDHPTMLQTFIWQHYDLAPQFPELHRFLEFWERELDGPLHSVKVAHQSLVRTGRIRTVQTEFRLH